MLEKLKGTFDKSIAAVSVKSEVLVESSRTKTTISNAQKRMETELNLLGLKVYQAWKNGESSLDKFAADLAGIQTLEREIADLKSHLEEIKQEENRILGTQSKPTGGCFCINCGKALPAGSRFCDECGTPVGQDGVK